MWYLVAQCGAMRAYIMLCGDVLYRVVIYCAVWCRMWLRGNIYMNAVSLYLIKVRYHGV